MPRFVWSLLVMLPACAEPTAGGDLPGDSAIPHGGIAGDSSAASGATASRAAEGGGGFAGSGAAGAGSRAGFAGSGASFAGSGPGFAGSGVGGQLSRGGPSCAPERGLAVCDDFESNEIDRQLWSQVDAAVSLDLSFAHSGQHSVRVLAKNVHDGGGWLLTHTPGALHKAMYGRARVFLRGPAPNRHSDFIKAEGQSAIGHAYYRYGIENGNLTSNYFALSNPWIDLAIPNDRFDSGAKPYAARVDAWVCVEWHFDGPSQKTELWLDGTRLTALVHGEADQKPWPAPVFEESGVGFQIYQEQGGRSDFEIWFDDVALDEERIGCE